MSPSTGSIRRARPRRRAALGAFGAILLLVTLGTGTATATITDRSVFGGPYAYDNWDCGYHMHVSGSESHHVLTRADKQVNGNVFVTDNYSFRETWTADDGRSFVQAANGLTKDVRARPLGGTLYEFTFHQTGQPAMFFDSAGNLVARDRGSLSFTYTIDLADGTFTFLGVRISGPHPLFVEDGCKVVAPLTGTASADYLTPRYAGSTGFPLGFYEYLPPSYQATGTASPLLLAFNGYGESGDGSPDQLPFLFNTGIPRFINIGGWPTDRPLVVLAMQHYEQPPGFDFSPCDGSQWGGSCNMQLQHDRGNVQPAFCTTPDEVHDFINFAISHYNVDPKRVYVTGLSCGAFGVWEYLAKYHGSLQVAAAIPIAGDGRPGSSANYCALGATPLWAFAGEQDDVVNPQGSIEPLTALASCPGPIPAVRRQLTTYPDLFHDGWDQAYSGSRGQDIYSWMLQFSQP